MNNYSVYNEEFLNSVVYQDFKKKNSGFGYLRIRAYTASEAYPIKGLQVRITTNFLDKDILFFQGSTDESGLIDRIPLPAPVMDSNNLSVPEKIIYQVQVQYAKEQLNATYSVSMYDGVCSVQNVSIGPMAIEVGVMEWR